MYSFRDLIIVRRFLFNPFYLHPTFRLILLFIPFLLMNGCSLFESNSNESTAVEGLFPIKLNGKWGYMRSDGSVAVAPQFDEARYALNGFATFRNETSWGILNVETELIAADASFAQIGQFNSDLAPAKMDGELYGFVNSSGSFVIDKNFTFADQFSFGRAAVLQDGLWGFVNETGQTAIGFNYSAASRFYEELAAVQTETGWKYIDESGTVVISPAFRIAYAGNFSEDLAPVQTSEGWGYINKKGALTISIQFDEAFSFSEGLARVKVGDYFGFIDNEGNMEIEPQFSEAKDFHESLAAVRVGNTWLYIHKKTGTIAFTPEERINHADDFYQGLARVQVGSEENPRYGYINTLGEYVWYPTN